MILTVLFFLVAGAFLSIVVLQGQEITKIKKYCSDTTQRLASFQENMDFGDEAFEKLLKEHEWLKLKAGAPMTLILDQKTPLKIMVNAKMVKPKTISQRPHNTDALLAKAAKQIKDL